MIASLQCPVCGSPVPSDAPAGQCPGCLLALASGDELIESPWPEPGLEARDRPFGDYRLGRQIGAGGMGIVYEAQQVSLNRKVAVKLIRDSHLASPVRLCRLAVEAEAVARLDHPNIVRIIEVGEQNGYPFLSMDFIDGESLSAKIAAGRFNCPPTTEAEPGPASRRWRESIARLMSKIAHAVQHAHERGVLHRDLKPGNILIDEQGEPHLTDFGLAKILQEPEGGQDVRALTATGDVHGTPGYMAPEQVSGQEATRAADIYGLGVILFELLVGRVPFGGSTPLETFKQIVQQPPPRLRSVNAAIDADLETICLKCLEKDPRHRYGTAAALAGDLDNWLAGRAIRARPAGSLRRLRQWIRRNPVGTALIASLGLGLCVALALLKVVNDQRREIEQDRDLTFEEGMNRISSLWRDAATKEVTIAARELAILGDRAPGQVARAERQLCFGISTDGEPSSLAQRYARFLNLLQDELNQELGTPLAFHLKLFKRFNQDAVSLARGDADLMLLSATSFLKAQSTAPSVMVIARERNVREAVIFTHTNAGAMRLMDLSGRSIAFPDPSHTISVWAKARLAAAGLQSAQLRAWTNLVDQRLDNRQTIVSTDETIDRVLRREMDAGVTYRKRFELSRHLGLVMLDQFSEAPDVLAARQGLDSSLIEALRKAIRAFAHRDRRASSSSPLPHALVPADESDFEPLRNALRQAERFEQGANN